MWIQTAVGGVLAYFIGSIPSAYLLVRWRFHQDITRTGSGNVGAINALRTTHSKPLAVLVLLVDFSKGLAVVLLASWWFPANSITLTIMTVAVVVGHNYPIWLKFRGGRGLASSAGVLTMVAPKLVGIWLLLWGIGYLLWRTIVYASVAATLLIYLLLGLPGFILAPVVGLRIAMILGILILIRHVPRFKEAWQTRQVKATDSV